MQEKALYHIKGLSYAYFVIWLFVGLGWVSFGGEWDLEKRIFFPLFVAAFTWISVFLATELVSGLIKMFGQVLIAICVFLIGGAGYAALLAAGHIIPPELITIHKELLQPFVVGGIYGIFPLALQPQRFRIVIPRDGEGGQRT